MKKTINIGFIIIICFIFMLASTACQQDGVTLNFETNGGSKVEDMQISQDFDISKLPVPTRKGYSFDNWFLDKDLDTIASVENIFAIERKGITLYAGWTANLNTLVFHANGGEGQMPDMQIATDQTQTLEPNQFHKEDYAFGGWAESKDGQIAYQDKDQFTMGEKSQYTLYAVWAPALTIFFNANGGQGQMQNQIAAEGLMTKLSPNTFTKEGYFFSGWALSSQGQKSYDDEGFLQMEKSDITLYAIWIDVSDIIEIIDEKSFYFGEYPQTLASIQAEEQMNAQPDSQGYYISQFDSQKYVKVTAKPENTLGHTGSLFQNQQEILYEQEYFFKVEPIKWTIIEKDNSSYLIVSDLILDRSHFGDSNIWDKSYIRDWLNQEFLNTAFDEDQAFIINKNQNITYYYDQQGEHQKITTEEKIFLLSQAEIRDMQETIAYVSDYAKALGVWTGAGELHDPPNPAWQIHTGMYLLRSGVLNANGGLVDSVRYHGSSEAVAEDDNRFGIRPAAVITKY